MRIQTLGIVFGICMALVAMREPNKTGSVTENGYSVFDPEVILMNADGSEPKVFLPGNESVGWSLDWR